MNEFHGQSRGQSHGFSRAGCSRSRVVRATSWFGIATAILGLTASVAAAPVQQEPVGPREETTERPTPAQAVSTVPSISPITGPQRVTWIVRATIGPESLAGGEWSAGLGSWKNKPPEFGRGWHGFAKRYGMRLTGVSVSNAIEGSLGAAWGEDPRYSR